MDKTGEAGVTGWVPDLSGYRMPAYLAVAEALAEDIQAGRLAPETRLPTQRDLADALDLNFTTVARAYAEARKRGLIDSHVGRGTFVRRRAPTPRSSGWRPDLVDRAMNLPPEPTDEDLLAAMRRDYLDLVSDLTTLMRYQASGGSAMDRVAGIRWLGLRGITTTLDTILVAPGTHAAMQAIVGALCAPGATLACEAVTYPGIVRICAQLGVRVRGLPADREGVLPDALAQAIAADGVRAVYLNPTLQNPTTRTVSDGRRRALVQILRETGTPIIEDDIYGHLPAQPPRAFATLAPELAYHVSGLSKTLGAGLRVAYVTGPTPAALAAVSGRLQVSTVMATPLTLALATRWIDSGVADRLLAFVRSEAHYRQGLLRATLPADCIETDPDGFHAWIHLPPPWRSADIVDRMRGQALAVVNGASFLAHGDPGRDATCAAMRLCLGGVADRQGTAASLEFLADTLATPQ